MTQLLPAPKTYGRGVKVDYHAEIARLDAISRTRALSEVESIILERLIWRVENKTKRRASFGENKILARAGIGRRSI